MQTAPSLTRLSEIRWRASLWKKPLDDGLDGHRAHKDRQFLLEHLEQINRPKRIVQAERQWRFEYHSSSTSLVMQQLSWDQAMRMVRLFSKPYGDGHVYLYSRSGDQNLCAVCGDRATSINSHSDNFGHTLSLCDIHSDLF